MPLPPLVLSLLRPEAYPDRPSEVTLQQTHISYLFFTPEHVYKVKKPVNFGFLDFTTLAKRLRFCREEVRLNNRLARGVYIGVVPITKDNGAYRMEGKGSPVEYAVKMKRLAAENMLDSMIRNESVTTRIIDRIAEKIAAFHRYAETSTQISAFGSLETIRQNTEENFIQIIPYKGKGKGKTIGEKRFSEIRSFTEAFLERNASVFKERIEGGFIKDCHGDIHSEHISVTNGISIFDCIEFNQRFRYSDTVADAAFLSMDLEFRGRGDLARIFDDAYFSYASDPRGRLLLDFYKCYRAFVRGKVESFKLTEQEETPEDKRAAFLSAIRYFRLSHLYATGGYRPIMFIVCGLTATGKTTLARIMKEMTGMFVLSSDAVRKELFAVPVGEHRYERFGEGIYSSEATDRTYSAMIEKGGGFLASGRSVILDATFSKKRYLEDARRVADRNGAMFFVVECVADDDTIKRRLDKRAAEKGTLSDATWQIYLKLKERFEGIDSPDLRLSTDKPPSVLARLLIERLFTERP